MPPDTTPIAGATAPATIANPVQAAIDKTAAETAAAAGKAPTVPAPAQSAPAAPEVPTEKFDLTREAFNDRIGKAKTSATKAAEAKQAEFFQSHYGTTDMAEVQKLIAERKATAEASAERDRAEMSELQRTTADLARERARAEQWEQKYTKSQSDMVFEQQGRVVDNIAQVHIAPKFLKHARRELAEHLTNTVGEKAAKNWTEKDLKQYFGKVLLKEYPEWAATPAEKAPAKKQPISNGVAPGTPKPKANPVGQGAGKDLRPGRPNSMTRSEARAHARKMGYDY